jgi:hypothetical protein
VNRDPRQIRVSLKEESAQIRVWFREGIREDPRLVKRPLIRPGSASRQSRIRDNPRPVKRDPRQIRVSLKEESAANPRP